MFSSHENSIIYEQLLEGKSGIVKKVTNRLFDQQITVDFDYILQFSPTPIVRSSIFKTADRDSVIQSVKGRKITFCLEKSKWNTEQNVSVCGAFLSEIGGQTFDLVDEIKAPGSVYYGLTTPTTEVKFIKGYYEVSPIGPEYKVSADNLIFKK